jgi:CBS domain-containing protein
VVKRTVANDDAYLQSKDSVLCALTDFRRECLITVEADSVIGEALDDMSRFRIHALLVTSQVVGSFEQQVVGLITRDDIERSRPRRRRAKASVSTEHRARRVADVMTAWNELPLIRYESLQSLTASVLYEMLQRAGFTHLLVIETQDDGSALARGLLSRAALAKRLRRPRPVSGP